MLSRIRQITKTNLFLNILKAVDFVGSLLFFVLLCFFCHFFASVNKKIDVILVLMKKDSNFAMSLNPETLFPKIFI